MASVNAKIDQNDRPTLTAVTDDANQFIQNVLVDPTTGALLVSIIGGGSAIFSETPTGVIDGANKAYTTVNSIVTVIGLYLNGEYIDPSQYTVSGSGFTMGTAIPAQFSGTPFTIVYSSTSSSALSFFADTVSGTINGSNKIFTVPNTISSALALFLAGIPYQPTIDFTVSGTTVTLVTAPDSSLSGQPFWLLHT